MNLLLPLLLVMGKSYAKNFSATTATTAFLIPPLSTLSTKTTNKLITALHETTRSSDKNSKNKKKQPFTIKDLVEQAKKNPNLLRGDEPKKNKYKRTRKRVDKPKQRYEYAKQKRFVADIGGVEGDDAQQQQQQTTLTNNQNNPIQQARKLGLVNAASQHCDPIIGDVEPEILGTIRVGNDDETNNSGMMAYVINKPAGWSILGGAPKKNKKGKNKDVVVEVQSKTKGPKEDENGIDENDISSSTTKSTVKVQTEEGDVDFWEVDEMDILALMTPEERAEFEADGGLTDGGLDDVGQVLPPPKKQKKSKTDSDKKVKVSTPSALATNIPAGRPSVVAWLKDQKAAEGVPIRGGKYWTAIAGATNVDDTGLVVICPKDKTKNVFVDFAKYVAVVGNGQHFAPKGKTKEADVPKELMKMEILSKLRKGRDDDTVLVVGVTCSESMSTCTSVVQPCQNQFLDGVRGDPTSNPLDRRAHRRLVHCESMSVSSLVQDDSVHTETESLPDDIRILGDRRNNHAYVSGSFLGRSELRKNPLTNAYREINGEADGFPGWTVDRYDKWLLVQHDDKFPRGPLPSIHDGNTAGVYYLPANPDRSAMGSRDVVRPILIEGQAAPDLFPIVENGVTYLVSLEKDLSTGIFLDQRPQRGWLARNCNEETSVLNCFAHCGAFSIAAATTGAGTVSLDLDKKWLDRIEPQMSANGIDFGKHDTIYGDCFDWLARLGKRGESYDIVILDPPSTSVGKKKRRWSVKNDMHSLVALAAPLVKQGGLLWTTTNNASIAPHTFARSCKKGLEEAGVGNAKLERIAPMPTDFSLVGQSPVKNLVWRLP